MEKEIKFLQNKISHINNTNREVGNFEQEEILSITSASMEIIAIGIGLFALFGGFLSLINVNQSREMSETTKKAKHVLKNQRELSANRFLQEGRFYTSWNRPHYARESYELAIKHGRGTFSALVAEFALISMYADILSDKMDKLADVEKQFEGFIKELQEGKHYYRGRRYLRADSYFTLACIYANFVLSDIDISEKEKYAKKACKMFEYAIREDYTNPDIYRNYAAHLSVINKMSKCKKQIRLAQKYAKKDVLLAEFMDQNRLIDLFTLRGKRSVAEAKEILSMIGVVINNEKEERGEI